MHGSTIHASPTDRRALPLLQTLAIGGVAAVFMASIGALGSGNLPWPYRLSYWVLVMGLGSLIGKAVSTVILGWGGLAARPLYQNTAIALAVSAPLTLLLLIVNWLFFDQQFNPYDVLGTALAVLLVSSTMTAILALVHRARQQPAPHALVAATMVSDDFPNAPFRSALAARLPLHLQAARIDAIEAQDHYCNIYTDAGAALLLIRLADAIAEVEGIDGIRCHRSWWVARHAVRRVERRSAGAVVVFGGDRLVPVSRPALQQLRSAGWL